jgi:hypothetical protein
MKYIFILLVIISQNSYAGFYTQYNLHYDTDTDSADAEEFQRTKMVNSLLLGASFGKRKKLIIGQSFSSWTKQQQKGASDNKSSFNFIELGPKFLYYLTRHKTWFISLTYNFYVRGTSKVNNRDEKLSGSSTVSSFGYHLPVSESFAMGVSLNYHDTTITESVENNLSRTLSEKYTSLYPSFEFVFHF